MKKNDAFSTITNDKLDGVTGGQMLDPNKIFDAAVNIGKPPPQPLTAADYADQFSRMMNR